MCFPSLPSSYMLGEGFPWVISMSISTDPWDAERGYVAELKPRRLLPNSCSTIDNGDAGRVPPFFLSIPLAKQCCEDKYLQDCEELRWDGCRRLRDLTLCKCGYSLLMGLVCSAKCKKPCLHTVRPQFHLQLSAWSRKHLIDQLESIRGIDLMWDLGCSAMVWG